MRLRLTYDGSALDTHEMDVRSLAPSLLAAADLFEAAGMELLGTDQITVRVTGSFRTGSFGIDLGLRLNGFGNMLVGLFAGAGVNAAANLKTLVDTIYGLIKAVQKKRNRQILTIERRGDGKAVIVFEEKTEMEVAEEVARLFVRKQVMESLAKVIAPLEQPGIQTIAFGTDDKVEAVISKDEMPYFQLPEPPEEMLIDEVRHMALSLVAVAFREDNKWRVSDGQNTLFAAMEDKTFLDSIDRGESFAKGDLLVCEVRIRQSRVGDALRTEYSIEKVMEHRRPPQQLDWTKTPPH